MAYQGMFGNVWGTLAKCAGSVIPLPEQHIREGSEMHLDSAKIPSSFPPHGMATH